MMPKKDQVPVDPMQLMDDFAQVAEAFAGMRAQLVARGFSEQQAGDLVVLVLRQGMQGAR